MVGLVNRLLAAIAACVLISLAGATAGWAAAPASVNTASDASAQQTAALGAGFATPLTVVVRDATDAPVAAVSVHFQGPVSGAGATLSATDVVTDVNGVASVTATANATGGFYSVRATVTGVTTPATFTLLNLSPGFSPGEQLADVQAPDHAGVGHTLREFLESGQSFLLVDVCTAWCTACRSVADQSPGAIADLAALGIKLHVVPLLQQGPTHLASTQNDAATWRTQFGLTDPVLHTSGSTASFAYSAASMFLRSSPGSGVPTSLLVAPNGVIIDRKVGSDQLTRQRIVERVLDASDPSVHQAQSVGLTVTRGADTVSGTAAPEVQAPFGTARVEPSLRLSSHSETFNFHFTATNPFHASPDTLHVEMTPNWDDGRARTFDGAGVPLTLNTMLNGQPVGSPHDPTNAATFVNGKITVDVDLGALYQELAAGVGDGVATGAFTEDQRDEILGELKGIEFSVVLGVGATAPTAAPTLTYASGPSRASIVAVTGTAPAGTTVRLYLTADCSGSPVATTTVTGLAAGVSVGVPLDATSRIRGTATGASGQPSPCAAGPAFIQDSKPPVIGTNDLVTIDSTASSVAYKYAPPAAKDGVDGAIVPVCSPKSGSSFAKGKTLVTCTAKDRAGNSASSSFTVVVRAPTTPGAVFKRGGKTKLRTATAGLRVLVAAGGFQPISPVTIRFVAANGTERMLGRPQVARSGRFSLNTRIPTNAKRGRVQITAVGRDRKGAVYARVWVLTIR